MAEPARKRATHADVLAAPEHVVAGIIDGVLETHPRPSPRHGAAAVGLGAELTAPFQKGRGGPGGWVSIIEPEVHPGAHVLVPDLAGRRREHLSVEPNAACIDIAPDWVCEVLSASTHRRDRGAKRRIYEAGVRRLRLLDPRHQELEAVVHNDHGWQLIGARGSDDGVSALPFDVISISLADLWPLDRPLGFEENPQHLFSGDR